MMRSTPWVCSSPIEFHTNGPLWIPPLWITSLNINTMLYSGQPGVNRNQQQGLPNTQPYLGVHSPLHICVRRPR